jgi:hypothetical protein
MSGGFPHVPGVSKEYQQATPVDPQSRGSGWSGRSALAGIWLLLIGGLHAIWAIVALAKPEKFAEHDLVWENLAAWGWIYLIVGAIQLTVGWLVLSRRAAGRILGVFVAMFAILLNFFTIGAHPLWSVIIIAGSALVLWALTDDYD